MVTLNQARRIVQEQAGALWAERGGLGEFTTLPAALEDDTGYLITGGARELIVDDDEQFVVYDWPALFVDKRTGLMSRVPVMVSWTRAAAMTPITDREDTNR